MILPMEPVRQDSHQNATVVFRGRLFTVERLGTEVNGHSVVRDVVCHPGAVVIVPILNDGRIVCIRNYRIAVGQWLLELPAGTREDGESPEATAARELAEETGYVCGRIRGLGTFYTTPGIADECMYVYAAESLTATEQRLEPGEQIEVVPLSLQAISLLIQNRELVDGKTIAALHMLALDRERESHG